MGEESFPPRWEAAGHAEVLPKINKNQDTFFLITKITVIHRII